MCGAWLTPVSILLSLYFAAYVKVDGAVASFEYANNLFTIIVGILTYGVCNFVFPRLSRIAGDKGDFKKVASDSLFYCFMIILPVMATVLTVPEQIVAIIYKRGEFTAVAAHQVTTVLYSLVPGMLGFTAVELLSRVFYADKSVVIPMTASLCGIGVNAATSYIAIIRMNMGLSALGISFAAGLCSAAAIMAVAAAVKFKGFFSADFAVRLVKLIICALGGYAVMRTAVYIISPDAFNDGFFVNVAVGGGVFIAGTAVYLIFCRLTGLIKKG